MPPMALGFVLINAEPGKERHVHDALAGVPDVTDIHPLRGEYDLLAKVEAPDFDTLGRVVVEQIRAVDGVLDTRTLTGTKF